MPVNIDNVEVITQPEPAPQPQAQPEPAPQSARTLNQAQLRKTLKRMAYRADRLRAD